MCSGVIDEKLNGKEIIAVLLDGEGDMRIGYITHRKGILSRLGKSYLEALSGYVKTKQPERKPEHRGRFNERNRNGGTICDTEKIVKEHIRKLK